MRLTVHFHDDRPEAQPSLKLIPSSEVVSHPKIRAAIAAYEEARADELERRRAHVEAQQELPAAEYRDEVALADAKAAKKADPGDKHRQVQLTAIAEAKRQHGAAKVTLERAVAGVVEAFDAHGDEYEVQIQEERAKLRQAMGAALDTWAELHRQLQRTAANLAIGDGFARPSDAFLASIAGPGGVVPVRDVLERLRGLGAPPEQKAVQAVEHRLHPGQTPRPKETADRRHPGQTERPVLDPARRAERLARAEARRANEVAEAV
jgi:hypothetical protein